MNGEVVMEVVAKRIGELEVENLMLRLQIENLTKQLKESKSKNDE